MANSLLQNPLVIDTAGATVLLPGPIRIAGVKVVGLTTSGHSCVIADSDGTTARTVYEHVITTSLNVGGSYEPINVMCKRGIAVTTLSSGKVYIYLGTGGSDA